MPYSLSSRPCSVADLQARIRQLEAENEELRAVLARHGIEVAPSSNVVSFPQRHNGDYFGA